MKLIFFYKTSSHLRNNERKTEIKMKGLLDENIWELQHGLLRLKYLFEKLNCLGRKLTNMTMAAYPKAGGDIKFLPEILILGSS